MGIKRLKNGQEKLRKQGVRLRLSEKTQANLRKKECASGWIASNVGNIRGVDAASTSPPSTTALRAANAACAARGLVLSSQPPLPRQLLCNCNHPGLRLQLPQALRDLKVLWMLARPVGAVLRVMVGLLPK
ncbi:hypothetical protein WN943_021372 [Citrus x changshan-huyou]